MTAPPMPHPAIIPLHWLLFSRAPRLGASKTRLAQAVGAAAARNFHACCLRDLYAEAARLRVLSSGRSAPEGSARLHLFVTPPDSRAEFRAAGADWPPEAALHPQEGGDLGQRMANAFAAVHREAGSAPLLLTGSDLPLLRAEHLLAAAAALRSADAVFGPTEDGGYYLVGLREPAPALFALDAWGQGPVLARTLAIAEREGLRTASITPLPDADTLDDLRRIRRHPLFARLSGRESCQCIESLLTAPPPPR